MRRGLACLFLSACGAVGRAPDASVADLGDTPDLGPADQGVADQGVDADADFADLGIRDALTLDLGPAACQPDIEGCACHVGLEPRGSCRYSDNHCLTWPGDVPVSSCVTPCSSDDDCTLSDLGQSCADVGLGTKICTARAAQRDQVCRGSRIDGEEVTGCSAGLSCVRGVDPNQTVDEGWCAEPCTPTARDPNGGCRGEYGYCNPAAVVRDEGTGPRPIGICSRGQRGHGSYCSIAEPSERCDTAREAGALACLAIGVGPPGHGVCVEECGVGQAPCRATDPVFGTATCSPYNPAAPRLGLCTFPCSTFPEDCSGPGLEGLGRTCVNSLALDPSLPLSFCWDITGPLLRETIGRWNGGALTPGVLGDACGALPSGLTRCPDGLSCVYGYCLRGCDVDDNAACATATSTAVSCYGTPTPTEPSAGLCLLP
ncbi:MAG: hypothetical protein IPG45_22930 [Deltaproteobacteria bacterium]|nr:hypothetical protein [Deltaproteobacteria bacterium]